MALIEPRFERAVRELIDRVLPEARVEALDALGGEGESGALKATGYGEPVCISVRTAEGERRRFVLRGATANAYGHDRRADRFAEVVLDYDTFGEVPRHVRPLALFALGEDGFVRLSDSCEPFLLTSYADGTPYAEDLVRLAREPLVRPLDFDRCDALADYLVALHREGAHSPTAYARAVRDLVGSGEGIFGVVDGYPPDTPAAPPARLKAIEERVLDWRWRLRERARPLRRAHGDFHPYNVLFQEGTEFALVDASRGCLADPADDVTAMAINYVFFALDQPRAWETLGPLWRRFWSRYEERSGERELREVIAPYLAWRGLVVASPRFYPGLSEGSRDALLAWIEASLELDTFDPGSAEELFR